MERKKNQQLKELIKQLDFQYLVSKITIKSKDEIKKNISPSMHLPKSQENKNINLKNKAKDIDNDK